MLIIGRSTPLLRRLTAARTCRRHCSTFRGTSTAAIHADALENDDAFGTSADVAPPLSLSTTYSCPEPGTHGHVYSRISSPTRERCEALLGAIEGTPDLPAHAILYASGLAATFSVLSRLLPSRVAISGGYHGTHLVLDQIRRISVGNSCDAIPLPPPSEARAMLRKGDVVWLETPRNPDCWCADIGAYVAAAREVGGVHVIVDGTFAPPPLQRPLALGADVVMHSTTKSLAGHSDAMGGALCARCPADRVVTSYLPRPPARLLVLASPS